MMVNRLPVLPVIFMISFQSYVLYYCAVTFFILQFFYLSERYEELYCFSFKTNFNKAERDENWDFIDMKAEYSRMGVPNKLWHVTSINREYRVSVYLNCYFLMFVSSVEKRTIWKTIVVTFNQCVTCIYDVYTLINETCHLYSIFSRYVTLTPLTCSYLNQPRSLSS